MQLQVNLLPKAYRPKPAVRAWPVIIAILFIVNMLGMSVWLVFVQLDLAAVRSDLRFKEVEVKQLDAQVKEAEVSAVLQKKVKDKREFIDTQLSRSRLWLPLMDSVQEAMVPGITLQAITFTNSGNVVFGGDCDSAKTVMAFAASLQEQTGNKVIKLSFIQPGTVFQLTLEGWSGREGRSNE